MIKRKIGNKILAFVLAGCLVLPTASYITGVNFTNLFSGIEANAATTAVPILVNDPTNPDFATKTDPTGKYYVRSYYEIKDTNGNGTYDVGEPMEILGSNPSSDYYTRYRKTQYYITGNTAAYGSNNSPSNAGSSMVRFNSDGSRKETLKTDSTQTLGSEANPCVIVEIVPDDFATGFSYMVRGQENYDQIYANLFTNAQGGATSDFQDLNSFNNITYENVSISGGNYNSGIWYTKNSFTKEVLGFGYRDQELAQAPEIDRYIFNGWYVRVGDSVDSTLFDSANLTSNYNAWPADTSSMDLHVYAKWSYKAYDNIEDDTFLVYEGQTTWDTIDDSRTFTVDSQTGSSTVKVLVNGGEKEFASVTFHYALPTGTVDVDVDQNGVYGEKEPSGTDVDGDGLIGEYEVIDLAPKANISFENDYDFKNQTIDLRSDGSSSYQYSSYSYAFNTKMMWYPSIMGNTDWNILSTGEGYVQVVTILASEFMTGDQAKYEKILDNADLVYIPNEQYGGHPWDSFKKLAANIGGTAEQHVTAYKALLRQEVMPTVRSEAISGTTLVSQSSVTMKNTDLEAYAVWRIMQNMAADNSSGKQIPVFTESNLLNGAASNSNIKKMLSLTFANSDYSVAYETWKDHITIGTIPGYNYPASTHSLILTNLNGNVVEDWSANAYTALWPYNGLNRWGNPWDSSQGTGALPSGGYKDYVDHGTYKDAGYDTLSPGTYTEFQEEQYGTMVTVRRVPITNVYQTLVDQGWLYNATNNGDNNINTSLTNSLMVYNSNNAFTMNFLLTGEFSKKAWTEDGYKYLEEKGEIRTGTSMITTGLALHSLLFSGGGKTDMLIIDNASGTTSTTGSGSKTVYVIDDFSGAQSARVTYHLDTNYGTDYYIEYYKIKDGKDFTADYKDAIKTDNAVKLTLSGELAVTGTQTFGRKSVTSMELNTANIKEIETSGAFAGAAHLTNLDELDRLVGCYLNTSTLTADAKDKYVIVARHSDGVFIAYAYIMIQQSTSPFNLD